MLAEFVLWVVGVGRKAGVGVALALSCSALQGQIFELPVAFDRWMYPFNATPGYRATASTFAAFGAPDFDVRDAQILLGFDVSSVQPAPGASLVGVTVQVTTAGDHSFLYDSTFDELGSYLGQPDSDPGRPWEMYGLATRNGYVGLTLDDNSTDPTLFRENSPFFPGGPSFRGVRSVYVSDYGDGTARDISNNVDLGFEVAPWAIGQTDAVLDGETVPIGTKFDFSLELGQSAVRSYIEGNLQQGALFLGVSSLHVADFGSLTFPSMFTDTGSTNLGPTAVLRLEYATSVLAGDFNGDGELDCLDIDALVGDVAAGTGNTLYDVNGDGLVNVGDVNHWVLVLKETLLGDANLDFSVDGSDFGVWNAGKFTSEARWCAGDFNADGGIDGSDFGVWNANKFQSALVAVPEGSGLLGIAFGALLSLRVRRRACLGTES